MQSGAGMRIPSLRWPTMVTSCCAFAYAIACGSSTSEDTTVAPVGGGAAPASPTDPSSTAPSTGQPAPPAPAEEEGVDGPPQVQLIGRFETTDPAGPKASWPGSRIITRFVGTAISVTMSEFAEDFMAGAPCYWEVSIDDGPPTALPMIADNQPHVFDLAANLPRGPHKIELYKRGEMQTGIDQFLGFDLHGGRALPPPPRLPRHIEAMADSYGAGYGIMQLNAPDLHCLPVDHAGKWQNFHLAYPALLGARFGAEVEGTVYSGKGLTRGIWPTDDDGLIDYYPRANPNPAMAHSNPQLFDLKSWPPDAIVLVQGTVDNGLSDFRDVYRDFVVNQLRARAPKAHIFLVVPGRVAREKWIDTVTSVERERHDAGDLAVTAVIPGEEQDEEMTACGFHGSPAYHQRIAKEIGDVMAQKLGW
jgi:hypothetical protein